MAKKEAKVKEAPARVEEKVVEQPVSSGLRRVKVNQEELMKLQNNGKLVGYDPVTQEAIIK